MSTLAPYNGQRGSFISKVPLPDSEPDAAATFTVTLSQAWRPVMLGALMQLMQPSSWDTTDPTALALVLARSFKLIDIVAQAGGGSVQAGSASVTILAGTAVGYAGVTYPTAYSAAPIVVASGTTGTLIAAAEAITEIGFVLSVTAPTPVLTDTTETVDWLAEVAS